MSLDVREYRGDTSQLLVYCAALKEMGNSDDALLLADDNLYDFSLVPMISRFRGVNDNVVAVRDIGQICERNEEAGMNFGKCRFDEHGKVTGASHSFAPQTAMDAERVLLDVHILHKKRIGRFVEIGERGQDGLREAVHSWWRDFYVWQANNGFLADIGKPALRKKAEEHYRAKP